MSMSNTTSMMGILHKLDNANIVTGEAENTDTQEHDEKS